VKVLLVGYLPSPSDSITHGRGSHTQKTSDISDWDTEITDGDVAKEASSTNSEPVPALRYNLFIG
jgi:hypothetical protein